MATHGGSRIRVGSAAVVGSLMLAGMLCCSCSRPPSREERVRAAQGGVTALRGADFEKAKTLSRAVLASDAENSLAALVMAFCAYHDTAHEFSRHISRLHGLPLPLALISPSGLPDHAKARQWLAQADAGLETVESYLATASRDDQIQMELCLAAWERDWNHSGAIDANDRLLFQIEFDHEGNRISEGDPRRKPTFRFDIGDVYWARAMVSFQRALLNIILAYKWTEIDKLFTYRPESPTRVTIRMAHPAQMHTARALILAGIGHADRCRKEFLAETDDHGEWVPNPNQKDHPLPLPVDEKLYATWEGILGDMRRLLDGEEGISVSEMAQLGDHTWHDPPGGFVDLEKLTSLPGDIVLDFSRGNRNIDQEGKRKAFVREVLGDLFGDAYVPEMKPTPLIERLKRMKGEMDRGEESLERKLRYLLWLN